MSDERIIDFNELKNRVNEKDIDKFEGYMYDLFYKTQTGAMNMADFTREITKYMQENNVSESKLLQIQKKMMERYGFDTSNMEESLKSLGIDMSNIKNANEGYEDIRKKMSFRDKYNGKIKEKLNEEYFISNDRNDVRIILEKEKVTLISEKNIDLTDNELNEFLCSYKKMFEGKTLNVSISENIKIYEY
ncbi:MAG: DUF3867 domain-containing protein [Clostridium sp.]|uniref:DUF3867 domain-containing protein n=1 Tax=Clostridium TaxID=1485 RepID=UPI00215292E6|nr:DUF3867 domain-containing protein [Clostridium sp. LY3-2]MCR6513647.1 DUF3867 domain-containing protein [Clostridium sp. LY3-2]